MRRSQARARFAPPPAATPLTEAITGLVDSRITVTTRRPASISGRHRRHILGRDQLAHVADVGAGAEAASRARDDDDAHGFVGLELLERVAQLAPHLAREGVELVRAVERERADAALAREQDVLVLHASTRSTIVASPWPTPMHIDASP